MSRESKCPGDGRFSKCAKCKREYHACSVQECPHEAVQARIGRYICMYCCQACRHNSFEDGGQVCMLRRAMRERGKAT